MPMAFHLDEWPEPSPVNDPANGVLTGYQFAPVTDYNGNVVLKYTVLMAMALALLDR